MNTTISLIIFIISILIISGCTTAPSGIPYAKSDEINNNGYELFHNDNRVGHEPEWNVAQAIGNFQWNKEKYPNTDVKGVFNGEDLVYLESIEVLPIVFVPLDVEEPTTDEIKLFQQHISIAQNRFEELMKNRDAFKISSESPRIVKSQSNLQYFKNSTDGGAAKYMAELLPHFNMNRYNLSYVFLILVMNPSDNFPLGGARPINGGFNNGGGLVILSSFTLNQPNSNVQSTLQHELGHSFGLVHVDDYGYSMETSKSIMSYNQENKWNELEPPLVEGILIPEDLRALSENKKVFPNFYFDEEKDIPAGYDMKDWSSLVPMNLSIE
ncbi:MAG: hypothetical protein KAT05_10380 [Spirochaetes bacterium]|nr:hypothetical protein [Spirochaetota bacterium]